MSRLLAAWDELLQSALDGDFDEQQAAIFQIGLILERHNPAITGEQDIYDEELSRDLQRLMLAKDRLVDTINKLLNWATTRKAPADACLFAVSHAPASLVLRPFFAFLVKRGAALDDAAAYVATQIIDDCVRQEPQQVAKMPSLDTVIALLEDWQDAEDDLLADKALFSSRRLNNLMGQA
ncbi:MAG: hypothetical protein CL607_13060 [Anaerolineaceae bacterium]|nr:hypothetical protein [Anaerolineaceae bacterium]